MLRRMVSLTGVWGGGGGLDISVKTESFVPAGMTRETGGESPHFITTAASESWLI